MPTRLDDASPMDEKTFDFQSSAVLEQRQKDMIIYRPNLRYGLTPDVQIESQGSIYSGNGEGGSGETDLSVQYRFLKSENIPQFSLTPMIAFPSGKGMDHAELSWQLNSTYTLSGTTDEPKSEVHVNFTSRTNRNRSEGERGSLENFAFGSSHKITNYVAMILDVAIEEQSEKNQSLQVAELGFHLDLGRKNYIGLSYSQGFGNSCTSSAALLGYEKEFGI